MPGAQRRVVYDLIEIVVEKRSADRLPVENKNPDGCESREAEGLVAGAPLEKWI
jgi:hypothetical protein